MTLLLTSLFLCNQSMRRSLVLRLSLKRRGARVERKKPGILRTNHYLSYLNKVMAKKEKPVTLSIYSQCRLNKEHMFYFLYRQNRTLGAL